MIFMTLQQHGISQRVSPQESSDAHVVCSYHHLQRLCSSKAQDLLFLLRPLQGGQLKVQPAAKIAHIGACCSITASCAMILGPLAVPPEPRAKGAQDNGNPRATQTDNAQMTRCSSSRATLEHTPHCFSTPMSILREMCGAGDGRGGA